jgi:hypothetical protein
MKSVSRALTISASHLSRGLFFVRRQQRKNGVNATMVPVRDFVLTPGASIIVPSSVVLRIPFSRNQRIHQWGRRPLVFGRRPNKIRHGIRAFTRIILFIVLSVEIREDRWLFLLLPTTKGQGPTTPFEERSSAGYGGGFIVHFCYCITRQAA